MTIYGMLRRIRYAKDHPSDYGSQLFAHHGESDAEQKQAESTGGLLHLYYDPPPMRNAFAQDDEMQALGDLIHYLAFTRYERKRT